MNINEVVEQFRKNSGSVLLDVRTVEEYESGAIEGSINIPLDSLFVIPNKVRNLSKTIYVYCRSGHRAAQAVEYLKSLGYINPINIGGIIDYKGKLV